MIKRSGVAIILTSGALLLAGCGQSHSPSTTSSKGGTVVVAMSPDSYPNWFFPVINAADYTEINSQLEFLMYRPLIYLNSRSQVDYSRSLASHISENASGTTYTITLGHKYHWSNGNPITAQDVVFTWQLIKEAATLKNAPWTYGASGSGGVPADWKSVTAVGSNTVVVTLQKPANPQWFIHNGLSQLTPVPKSVWNKDPNNPVAELRYIQSVANSPTNAVYHVVDGPFRFDNWQPNNYWALVPNPKFGGHKASIGKIMFQYETSTTNEFVGLRNGTISVGYLPPSMYKSRQELTDDVMTSNYLFGMNYIVPNLNPKAPGKMGAVFSNVYVREALEMGIDQHAIINTLYHGAGVATDGPIPSQPPTVYVDKSLNSFPYPYSPANGKKLLEQHGWHDVGGTMTNSSGQKLAFTMLYAAGSPTEASMMQLIKSDWAQEGIDVTLQSMPLDSLLATVTQSDPSKWQMGYWNAGWTYQLDYYPTGGNLFATNAGENDGGYNNSTLDQLIQDTYAPGTPSQITARMDTYQTFMADHLPVLWMPWFPQGYAREIGFSEHNKNLHGSSKYFNPVTDYLYANYWTVSS